MGRFKNLVIIAITISNTFCAPNSENPEKAIRDCKIKNCRGQAKLYERGELVCYAEEKEFNGEMKLKLFAVLPCIIKCKEKEPHPNQTECFCNTCKEESFHPKKFCVEPHKGGLETFEDCDNYVCNGGGAKLRGESTCNKKE